MNDWINYRNYMKLVFRKWRSLKLGAKRIFIFFSPRLSYLLHSHHLFIERSLIMRTIMIVCIIKKYKEDQSMRKQDKTKQKYKTEGKNKIERKRKERQNTKRRTWNKARENRRQKKRQRNRTHHGTTQYSTRQKSKKWIFITIIIYI